MRNIAFDEVIHSGFRDSVIDYGIIYGSNTIVFIKAGQDGSMCGYKKKALIFSVFIALFRGMIN